MSETISDAPKKKGLLEKIGSKREIEPMTAERCAYETINGEDSFKTLPERIKKKQEEIAESIKSRYARYNSSGCLVRPIEFNCVITLEEDISAYAEDVFQPFIVGGFEIINLSKVCTDIHEKNVYFIPWRRAFMPVEKVVKL